MSTDFDAAIFKRRREALVKRMLPGVAIFPAAPEYIRNGDVHHDYRQHSDFYYLTGFDEPGSLALIIKGQGAHSFVLFVPRRDKTMEIWNGRRAGPEGAVKQYGADQAFTLEDIDDKVPEFLRDVQRMYVHLGDDVHFDERVTAWLNKVRAMKRQGYNAPTELHDPSEIVHEMRLYKNKDDLKYLRRAGEIAAQGHIAGMRATRPGMYEYEVQAEIEYVFRKQGTRRTGNGSNEAGGDNANILHYHEINMVLNDGELLLVDARC
jgi:Xaa-Pro aminopeptidase